VLVLVDTWPSLVLRLVREKPSHLGRRARRRRPRRDTWRAIRLLEEGRREARSSSRC